jgi:hypothetical protein
VYTIKPNFENIELIFKDDLDKPIWICWQEIPPSEAEIKKAEVLMREAKPVKMPIDPNTGFQAKTNDEKTWGTYWVAKAYYQSNPDKMSGLGLNYYGKGDKDKNSHILSFDLDDIKNESGEIKATVIRIITKLLSWTELTPSGKGCRIYVRENWMKGGRKAGIFKDFNEKGEPEEQKIEFFGEGNHYVTITGVPIPKINGFDNNKIEKRPKDLTEMIYQKVFPPIVKSNEVKEKDVEITESYLAEELSSIGFEYKQEWGMDQGGKSGFKFKITCPWGSEEGTEHESGVNNLGDAFIFVPEDHRRPWFHCSHATCKDKYSWEDFCRKVFGYILSDGSLNRNIMSWINDHPGEMFDHRFLQNEFHIFSESEKNNLRVTLFRAKKDNIIEQLSKSGNYRVISTKVVEMPLAKNEKKSFKIALPLNINLLGTFKPERIILVQGEVNAGKTAFNFSLIKPNYRITPIHYFSNSEIDAEDIESRMAYLFCEKPMEYWQDKNNLSFHRIEIETEFADVVRLYKDSIIICDYFDASKDYTQAAHQMARIHDKLQGTGNMAIVSVQININKEVKDNFALRAYGGPSLTTRPSTVFNLVKSSGYNVLYVQKFKQVDPVVYKLFYDNRWCRPYRVYAEGGFIEKTTEYWEHRGDKEDEIPFKLSDDKENWGKTPPQVTGG